MIHETKLSKNDTKYTDENLLAENGQVKLEGSLFLCFFVGFPCRNLKQLIKREEFPHFLDANLPEVFFTDVDIHILTKAIDSNGKVRLNMEY